MIFESKCVQKISRHEALNSGTEILKPHQAVLELGEQGVAQPALIENEAQEQMIEVIQTSNGSKSVGNPDDMIFVGIYRTSEEFVKAAMDTAHPIDMQGELPDETLHAVFDVFSVSHTDLIDSQLEAA